MNDYLREHNTLSKAIIDHPRLILVGYDFSGMGIRSVLCDDAAAARIATSMLQQAGHSKIALCVSDPESPIQRQIIAGWRSCFVGWDAEQLDELLIDCSQISPEILAARLLTEKECSFSGVVTASEHIGTSLGEAVRSLGIAIPDDLSIVTLGFSAELAGYSPLLACVDVQLDKQVKYAMVSVQAMMENRPVDLLHLVQPKIIPGQSIGNLYRKDGS